ncbi:MAG: Synechococcus phage [Actinomycetota bacterium]|jgi:hypothetical protein
MAQKTNLNVSPYFDDFSQPNDGARDKNYYKVLFNPGKPIQARELNTLQSILQNQVEVFGSHIFKEGSLVIPGNINYDDQFNAVKLNPDQYGVNISLYLKNFVGQKITGQISGVTATVQLVELPNSEIEYATLYVKYIDSDSNFQINPFQNNEPLYASETVGEISAGTPFATTLSFDSTAIGSAVSIGEGVYFIRGTFVKVPKQTIILDYYTNKPSYRIGLKVDEQIITAKDDSTLYDNAKGFTNYAAPGADRFKISLSLTKKLLSDTNDTDFVEILRVSDGAVKKLESKSNYSIIKDYIAQRTYDESGNYVVTPFQFSLNNSLNNRLGNDGLYFSDQKTDQGNTPSDDLLCLKFSPGKAYVNGYDIEKNGIEIIDLPKPRTTKNVSSENIPFEMGNLLRVNNVSGSPKQKQIIYLQNRRKNSTTVSTGSTIGVARVYNFNLTDASYNNESTNWDLYLYDIQTYTELKLNQSISSTELPTTSFVKGKSSGASGYAVFAGNGTDTINLRQTSGSFLIGEQISINGSETYSRTISSIKSYGIEDIKSVYQPQSITGFSTAFVSDTQLDRTLRSESITITSVSGGISTATISSPATFTGIKTDNIIRYQKEGSTIETYNRVVSISSGLNSMTLEAVPSVNAVCDGTLPSSTFNGTYSLGTPKIKNSQKGFLYAELPNKNIASIDLSSSGITFSAQSNTTFLPSSNTLTVNVGNFNTGINSSFVNFEAFDEERYSIFYSDGSIEKLTSDKVSIDNNLDQVTFSNIENKQISSIIATFVKSGIQSKIKKFIRSKTLNITLSKDPQSGTGVNTSINDGLQYNQYYGLRVQDEDISLNYPDVAKIIAIYESLDTNAPVLDQLTFSSLSNVDSNSIIGENIIGKSSNAVARIVTKPSSNTLGIVYLNSNKFSPGENVLFEESNINTNISSIILGNYRNITSKYILDKGQKEQYYDYSKIIRKSGESSPSRQLLVIFDYYSVSNDDTGDAFTVNSYDSDRFSSDIPTLGINQVRSSDTLDFRPRVSNFTGSSSSPFDFSSRSFNNEPKLILSPNEGSLVKYDFYLGRIDKLYLDRFGNFTIVNGTPSVNPKEPNTSENLMQIATIELPPYLYNPKDVKISLIDNRRYTMRDIGKIEDRVENLERVTSLSLLELNTQTLQIQDAQGLNRFKTGFFVDDFKNNELIDSNLSKIKVDSGNGELTTEISRNSINLKPVSSENISNESIDLSTNFTLYDSNTQKTGDLITLKYSEVDWIEQSLATKTENVNPFNVIVYEGTITLNPDTDTWVRTIQLQDINLNVSSSRILRGRSGRRTRVVGTEVSVDTRESTLTSGVEIYMRSRNTGFTAVNLKPLTRFYQFLDGNSAVDFIPKLVEIANDSSLENYGSTSSTFQVGETVIGSFNGSNLISFRVASSNHKEGLFNSPSSKYTINPYVPSENIPDTYSLSSKILNIDIESLCLEVQGLYSGYLTIGMKLVGQTSGAIAYVKDLKLISDNFGFLAGSFFLKDPNTNPPPLVRIETGSKVYKLTSSQSNETPLPGNKLISSGESVYESSGTWEERQRTITTTTTSLIRRRRRRRDPLAQSFTVGGGIETLVDIAPNDDQNGVFLTAVDLFFASKDSNNAPLTVEVRTVELGTPTDIVLGNPKILRPSDIQTSTDASIATHVTFDYPIYLDPDSEYAIVLLAPQSDQYEVWIAEMGEKTIETSNLPDSQSIRYTKQFAIGSLFKSQNGTIWTANQYQDLKFKLYKANFTSTSGSVLFHNPSLNQSNSYIPTLSPNPITILPRKVNIGVTTITDSTTIGILTTGRKISVQSATYNYGYIENVGSAVNSVGITTGGVNYSSTNNVDTFNISGRGIGLKLNITATSGRITSVSIASSGNGYSVGDVVGIVTSSITPSSGNNAIITITSVDSGIDTLYLTNVQGNSFNTGIASLSYYNISGNLVALGSTTITSSTPVGGVYNGNFLKVNHYDHGMYSSLNKIALFNVESDVSPSTLTAPLLSTDVLISVASTVNFGTFEGKPVNGTNPGYVKIENEIIRYESIGANTLNTITRGVDSTKIVDHDLNVPIHKYELGGVSLRRINKTHTISSNQIDIDSYYIEFDRSSNGVNRTVDNTPSQFPQLSFNNESSCGGNTVQASENIQFNSVFPQVSLINPGSLTSVSGQIRTVSGTSVSGNEASFIDQGYESVELGVENKLLSTRIVCSEVNEQEYLSSILRNKSFTLKLDLSTQDSNISPMIFWKNSSVELLSNRLNKPIQNYISDNRVNSLYDDPHAAIYVSNTVRLAQAATALKVIVSAYRHSSADFRVLYSLIRPDSSEVEPVFELFPGYQNLTVDNNQDNYLDVIDTSKNSGLPDTFVPSSLDGEFLEYEFSANNLGSFVGYTIKIVMSGTNQAYAPRFKDLRSIALA